MIFMENGGKRPGAGRAKGSKNRKTLEQAAVLEKFKERVMLQANQLFNAELGLAVGSVRVFRVDEEDDGKGGTKRVHTLITDAEEIKKVLDHGEGGPAVVGKDYYFVTEVPPDVRAIEAMMNRTFGKPKEKHELSGPNGGAIPFETVVVTPGG